MKSKILLRNIERYRPDAVEAFVRESIARIHPEHSPFGPGQSVLLKPNLLRGFAPEKCVTTHPVVVEAVCRVLKDQGVSSLTLSDSPAFGSLEAVAAKAGYGPLVKKYGLRIRRLSNPVSFPTEEPQVALKIAGSLEDYDHIVNLPKVKSHCQMTLTLGIKNLFGVVIGKRKPVLHCLVKNDTIRFGRMLVQIAKQVDPVLTIADGILAMQGQGPANGRPYPLGILAAGRDLTALDRVLSEILGVPAERVPALEAARQMGFGNHALDGIELLGETDLAALSVSDFDLAEMPLDISFNPLRVLKSVLKQFYEVQVRERVLRG